MRTCFVCLLALAFTACGPNPELQDKLIEGSPGDLADVLPGDLFTPVQGKSATMLPANKTNAELTAQIKADGYDPRDNSPYYQFTGAPGDISYMPGEFEPTQALLIGWPGASGMTSFFAQLIKAAHSQVATTVVYVTDNSAYSDLAYALNQYGVDTSDIYFLKMDLDTIWMRDYGPLLARTVNGGYRVIDLRYYYGRWDDDVAPTRLAKAWNVNVSRPPIDGEGGNFQSDGAGRCVMTDHILSQNASYGYNSQDIKKIFKQYLGCQTTVILPSLVGEGTGHVDMYVTITGAGEAIVGKYSTYDDPTNAKIVDQSAAMLQNAGFKVRRIPMPSNYDGNYRSYTNSLAIGNRVLVPVYSDDQRYESQALSVFKQAYPGRTIVPIEASKIIKWAGAVHCVTMTLGS